VLSVVAAGFGQAGGDRRFVDWLPAVQIVVLIAVTSGLVAWSGWWNRAGHDAIPQPAILYEQLADGQTARIDATVTWAADDNAEGPGVVAGIAIPARDLFVSVTIRENRDATLPASHLVEVIADAKAGFAGGQVAAIPSLMVPTVKAPKALAGISSKIADGAFWVALSAAPREAANNLRLLRYTHLLDVPLVYANGQRAALEFPQGRVSEDFFRAAMLAWERSHAPGKPAP
jgi:hypothetical protein